MKILLTGGAGYIGSHTAVVLTEAGHEVVLFDNFCNSRKGVLDRLQKILGKALPCIEGDIRDTALVVKTLQDYKINSVIHFAGLKAVGESTEKPIEYYANNVHGTISLLEAMQSENIKNLVFSSSATVYGEPEYLPIDESHPTSATNTYGRSKLIIEQMLKDIARSDAEWRIVCLRYFNPVGAHESGLIGEDPNGLPNNLMPCIARVALANETHLNIYGGDFNTKDGTGIRDYIHVLDLAEGHVAAINYLKSNNGWSVFNLGAGQGYSVLDVVRAYEASAGLKINCKVVNRREGDIASSYALVEAARSRLDWVATRDLKNMCDTDWNRRNGGVS